jgi:membrane fusion protein, multidrug efflux system
MNMRLGFVVYMIGVLLIAPSCGNPEVTPADRLKALRVERAKLDDQIRDLESTLGASGESVDMTPVAVQNATVAPFRHHIDVKGSVESRSSVMITPRAGGQITAIKVKNGQSVAKGQLLVELDAEILKRSVEELQLQLDFARTLYKKQERIYEQKAGSEIQYLSAKNQVESLEKRFQSLKEQLALSQIYSPTSGVVDNILPKIGENVPPGMQIMTIVNNSDNRVVVDLAEVYVSTVNVGDPVTIVFTETNDTVQTKIGTVSKSVNALNRTFRVEIPINGIALGIRPNSTCNVIINDQTVEKAISIPMNAVVRDNESSYCYIVNDKNQIERRVVNLGLISGASVQVTSGIMPNDRVVVRGVLDVAAGQKVKIVQ